MPLMVLPKGGHSWLQMGSHTCGQVWAHSSMNTAVCSVGVHQPVEAWALMLTSGNLNYFTAKSPSVLIVFLPFIFSPLFFFLFWNQCQLCPWPVEVSLTVHYSPALGTCCGIASWQCDISYISSFLTFLLIKCQWRLNWFMPSKGNCDSSSSSNP